MITKKPFTNSEIPPFLLSPYSYGKGLFLFSLLLSVFLLMFSIRFSYQTNSLLLLGIGMVQAGLTVFFLLKTLPLLVSDAVEHLRYRLFGTLLSGFSLLLSAGYIFCEVSDRYGEPVQIESQKALWVAGVVLAGNIIIISLMNLSRISRLEFGSFRLSCRTIGKVSFMVLLATALIHLTNYYFLDTILSLVLAVSLFVWAGFVVLDAYWRLGEVI